MSGRFGPDKWKTVVASAYDRHGADAVVAETNLWWKPLGEIIKTAVAEGGYPLNFREVTATRGKVARAGNEFRVRPFCILMQFSHQ